MRSLDLLLLTLCPLLLGACASETSERSPIGEVREIQVGTWRFDHPTGVAYTKGADGFSEDYEIAYYSTGIRFFSPDKSSPWQIVVSLNPHPRQLQEDEMFRVVNALVRMLQEESPLDFYSMEVQQLGDYWLVDGRGRTATPDAVYPRSRIAILVGSTSLLLIQVDYKDQEPASVVDQILRTSAEVGEWAAG